MEVSIGVIAHNEEKNIGRLLDALSGQETRDARIREIIVVSSSNDATNRIVRDFSANRHAVSLVEEESRAGKSGAINIFLRKAKSKVLVLVSGDVLPERDSVERLCSGLAGGVGIAAGRPVPEERAGFMGDLVRLQWRIHHKISLKENKFGEMIAFRKCFRAIDSTPVDEEHIAMLVKKSGFGSAYVPDALVRNSGPRMIKDFIKQRRRIYAGHLDLRRRSGHSPPTMSSTAVLRAGLSAREGTGIHVLLAGTALESLSRALGTYDFLFSRRKHVIWEMVRR